MLVDTQTIQQVLGSLMQHPQYLSEVDKYSLTPLDFNSRLEKYIFQAIQGLYQNGAEVIQPIDIENAIAEDPAARETFEKENGLEYVQDILELAEEKNFYYYYSHLKKLNLLKDLQKDGFDISDLYCEDLTDPKAEEINSKFKFTDINELIETIKKKILHWENKYKVTGEVETERVSHKIDEFVKGLGMAQEIGLPVQGEFYSQIIDGARRGTLTIRSAASGVGKTRSAIADACYLAYPFRYNWQTCEWEQEGNCERVLFIVTEQQFNEVRKMILAYLTDLNESRFKYANFSDREHAVIEQAVGLIKAYKDNLILVKMPNPTIEIVKAKIREECIVHDIGYVFYDYIFIGPSLLNEFQGFALRNDEVLLMFATALKDLAVELNVAMFTSTQLNAKGDNSNEIRNEGTLAGGRSTINKADNGAILARPTKDELETLMPLYNGDENRKPNLVTDIYKVRSGEWTQVRIWSKMNLGTLKKEDLFITDANLDPLENFKLMRNFTKSWENSEDEHINVILERLNGGEVIDKL